MSGGQTEQELDAYIDDLILETIRGSAAAGEASAEQVVETVYEKLDPRVVAPSIVQSFSKATLFRRVCLMGIKNKSES